MQVKLWTVEAVSPLTARRASGTAFTDGGGIGPLCLPYLFKSALDSSLTAAGVRCQIQGGAAPNGDRKRPVLESDVFG